MNHFFRIVLAFALVAIHAGAASLVPNLKPLQYDANGAIPTNSPFIRGTLTPALQVATLAFDIDAQTYCDSVGMTNPDEIQRVHQFVSGLKSMGFWTSAVQLLDLRSHHNIGTGTTATALKGGNATISGSPTWSTNGIEFTGVTTKFATFANPLSNPATAFTIATAFKANAGATRTIVGSFNASPNTGGSLFAHGSPHEGSLPYAFIYAYSLDGSSAYAGQNGRLQQDTAVGSGRYFGAFSYGGTSHGISIGNSPRNTLTVTQGGVFNSAANWYIGKTIDNALPLDGDVGFVGVWNVQMTQKQVQAVRRLYEYTIGNGYIPNVQMIWEGDSLTSGNSSSLWTLQEQVATNSYWGPKTYKLNVSASGAQTPAMVTDATTEWCQYRIDGKFGKQQYFCLWGGINDLTVANRPASQIITNLVALWDSARSYGMKVVAFTPTPSSGVVGGVITEYNSLVSLIRANSSHYDYLVDLAADTALQNTANTTYYPDGVHLSNAGYDLVMTRFLAAVPLPQ